MDYYIDHARSRVLETGRPSTHDCARGARYGYGHEKKTEKGYEVRKIGWVVVAAIVLSSLVGGIAQYYDERAKNASDAIATSKQEGSSRNLSR